jgi:hypothetical protein
LLATVWPAGAQELSALLQRGPVPYLQGPAVRLISGPLTAGDDADVAWGDYDGDGRPDVIVGSGYGDLLLYRGEGSGFAPPAVLLAAMLSFARDQARRGQVSPELADLNGDGVLDLVLGAGPDVYFYSRKGGLQPGRALLVGEDRTLGQALASRHLAPCVVDFDGDGDADLLLGAAEGQIWWVECLQAETLRFAEPTLLAAGGEPLKVGPRARVAAGDWDRDGRYDLIIGDATGRLVWARGRPQGLGAPQPLFPGLPPALPGETLTHLSPRLADLDGDGYPELLLGSRSGLVATYEYTETGPRFMGYLQAREVPLDVGRYAAPAMADLDGDGQRDLVVGAEDGLVRLYRGRADGFYEAAQPLRTPAGPILCQADDQGRRFSWPRLADLNGDGVLDLAVGGASGLIELWLNQGVWRPLGPVKVGGESIRARGLSALCLVDHDGDGDLDLFVGDMPLPGTDLAPAQPPTPRYVLPTGGLSYYENQSPKGPGLPVFLKGVRLSVYLGRQGRDQQEAPLDAAVLGPYYLEPLAVQRGLWTYLLGTRVGYYVIPALRGREYYPQPTLDVPPGTIPPPLFPPLYSCTTVPLAGGQPGLLGGLGEYGFVCLYPPDEVPQLRGTQP